jgi:hypothetical protein
MAAAYGVNSKEAKAAAIEAKKYKDTIDQANKATGDHTKNVGNYSSALKGLGSQFLAVTGLAGGLTMVIAGLKKAFGNYEEQIKQEREMMFIKYFILRRI